MKLLTRDDAIRVCIPLLESVNHTRTELRQRISQPRNHLAALKAPSVLVVVVRGRLPNQLSRTRL